LKGPAAALGVESHKKRESTKNYKEIGEDAIAKPAGYLFPTEVLTAEPGAKRVVLS
jgi:hypothetical protein